MKMKHLTPLFALLLCQVISAQVKIGDNPQTIDPSSLLELESTQQVLVITRVTTAQMDGITPAEGALLYNTDEDCLFYYNGQRWINLCEALGLIFTNEAIVNQDTTIIITEFDDRFNFEVGQIRSENIVDFSIGSQDIQNEAINSDKLASNSVGTDEIGDNAVTGAEIDLNLVTLGTFANDVGYLVTADLVSNDPGNDILEGSVSGVFYDNPDGITGNEIVDATDGTLVRNGGGIEEDPYTLDVNTGGITTEEIQDNTVQTIDLADDSVNADKIDASVAGVGLAQNVDGALDVDVSQFTGDGDLTSQSGTIAITGTPENALFEDVEVDVAISELISGDPENVISTGADGGLFSTDDQIAAEVTYDDTTSGLGSGNVQEAIDLLAESNQADLDTDPTNELSITDNGVPSDPGTNPGQTYVDLGTGQLFVWDGAIWLPVGGTNAADNDPDPQNEIQTLTQVGTDVSLSLGGGTISVADNDNDPINENQTVSAGDGIIVNQTGQDFLIVNDDPDQIVTLADGGSGNVAIGGTYPNLTIDVPFSIPTGTLGSIFFSDGLGGLVENNAQLFWDEATNRLGIGVANRPLENKLTVDGTTRTSGLLNSAGSKNLPSFRFSDNLNTGMYLADSSGELAFSTNSNEALKIDVNQNVGVAEPNPTSTLHTGGSTATPILNHFGGPLTLDNTHHTIIFSGNSDLTLPSPDTCPGRIYILNPKSWQIDLPLFLYKDVTDLDVNQIPLGTIVWIQSDGANWQQIN